MEPACTKTASFTLKTQGIGQFGCADGIDRFADNTERLIEATTDLGTEAQGKRSARLIQQIADGLEASPALRPTPHHTPTQTWRLPAKTP